MRNGSSGDLVAAGPRRAMVHALSRMKLGAIQWLILGAAVAVIAITLGTGYLALQYRERALQVAERDLNNTALLLSRHFDQRLNDLQHVHDDDYGLCTDCGVGIPFDRLKIEPQALRCVACESRHEGAR